MEEPSFISKASYRNIGTSSKRLIKTYLFSITLFVEILSLIFKFMIEFLGLNS